MWVGVGMMELMLMTTTRITASLTAGLDEQG